MISRGIPNGRNFPLLGGKYAHLGRHSTEIQYFQNRTMGFSDTFAPAATVSPDAVQQNLRDRCKTEGLPSR